MSLDDIKRIQAFWTEAQIARLELLKHAKGTLCSIDDPKADTPRSQFCHLLGNACHGAPQVQLEHRNVVQELAIAKRAFPANQERVESSFQKGVGSKKADKTD